MGNGADKTEYWAIVLYNYYYYDYDISTDFR